MSKILMVREVGDPVLYQRSKEVDVKALTQEDLADIASMKETLLYTGGYGIAAPQVGISKRIVAIYVDKENCGYLDCEDVPMTVMINPTWEKRSDRTYTEYEGCLSVPNIRGKVERYYDITVTYYTETGEKVVKEVSGFTARDIQHECDHLDGIVFLNRVTEKGYAIKENISKFHLKEEK